VLELQAANSTGLEHRCLLQGFEAGRRYSGRHDGVGVVGGDVWITVMDDGEGKHCTVPNIRDI
jgi:hypothetical protein